MSSDWRRALDRAVDDRFAKMVELRRRLHSHPEVSGEERQTSLLLYQRMGDEAFDVRMGPEGRGLIADSPDPGGGGLIALRADLDALRIHDVKQVDYRSRCDGIMHACGHDAHAALVYGALTALNDLHRSGQAPWPVRLRGVFQPAEEICQGARDMMEVGAMEEVEAILAAHVDPARALGAIALRAGVLTAHCDQIEITIIGRGGHAARPHEANDPIAAAAQMINALYLFVPRATDSRDAVVVTFGQVQGGDHANVIPEQVVLRGTIRTLDSTVRQRTLKHIRRLSQGVGQTTDTRIEVRHGPGTRSVCNDPHLVRLLRTAGEEILGEDCVERIPRPSMGSEDFAYYLDRTPGAMFRLGCRSERTGGAPLHSPSFDIDEEALRVGARVLARTVMLWSEPKEPGSALESRRDAAAN